MRIKCILYAYYMHIICVLYAYYMRIICVLNVVFSVISVTLPLHAHRWRRRYGIRKAGQSESEG